jgi:hypothetical protein
MVVQIEKFKKLRELSEFSGETNLNLDALEIKDGILLNTN